MIKNERRPLKSQLLQQNVFLRDTIPAYDLKRGNAAKEYYDVFEEDIIDKDGFPVHREVIKKVPYPHTPESVQSFESSTDYKTDPSNARRSGGVNLGDISGVQALFQSDSAVQNLEYQELLKKIVAFSQTQKEVVKKEKEVKDDE